MSTQQNIYEPPQWRKPIDESRVLRDDAYQRFLAEEASRVRWARARTAAWLCVAVPLSPLVVLYTAGRLAWEMLKR